MAADSGLLAILILFDLTVPYYTTCHTTLLNRLTFISITSLQTALTRIEFNPLKSFTSQPLPVISGVLQGSDLGPHLFIYLILIDNILFNYNIKLYLNPSGVLCLSRIFHNEHHVQA